MNHSPDNEQTSSIPKYLTARKIHLENLEKHWVNIESIKKLTGNDRIYVRSLLDSNPDVAHWTNKFFEKDDIMIMTIKDDNTIVIKNKNKNKEQEPELELDEEGDPVMIIDI